jgi:peptide/nickel transport system substrate-binding protein
MNNEVQRELTICMGQEPDNLYYYAGNMLVDIQIQEAIYDGPIDRNSFSAQPVILSKIPRLANGDAVMSPQDVLSGDKVVNDSGNPENLGFGTIVRPAGCRSSDCAIIYDVSLMYIGPMVHY